MPWLCANGVALVMAQTAVCLRQMMMPAMHLAPMQLANQSVLARGANDILVLALTTSLYNCCQQQAQTVCVLLSYRFVKI